MNIMNTNMFSIKDLRLAWERVISSVGTDTKDYFGISVYKSDIDRHLHALLKDLENDEYQPKRAFKYFEPKKVGTQRTKTVLSISDAIVYQAIADKIAYQMYGRLQEMKQHVFGSVLNENVVKGVELLEEDDPDFYFFEYYVNLYNRFIENISDTLESEEIEWKLETDITGFFDCIPHSTLVLELRDLRIESELLDLLAICLSAWTGTRDKPTYHVGIPQGPAASFLLANILLDSLDRKVIGCGLSYFRFMDDIRVYGRNKGEMLAVLALVDRHLKGMSLSINSSKTVILQVNAGDKEDDVLLDASGIPFESEKIAELGDEIVVQDQTQLGSSNNNPKIIHSHLAFKIYKIALHEQEKELKEILDGNYQSDSISKEEIHRFLTLSQKWRTTVKALKAIDSYSPNQDMVYVWLFGLRKIFWKANAMVWNLQQYETLEDYHEEFESVLNEFDRFEWVKYQILNLYRKVIGVDEAKYRIALSDLDKEESPLVRLGYFSILVESIEADSKLFESFSSILKREPNGYVKESVLNLIHRRHMSVPMDSIKEWFL